MSRFLTVVSGCSSGRLDGLDLAIPYTTRSQRSGDNQDKGFVFTSREVFEQMIERDEFLEYAMVFGNYYGTATSSFQQATERGRDILIKVDDNGLEQIKRRIHDVIGILILPGESTDVLYPFRRAMPNSEKYDHVLINDRPDESVERFMQIVRLERSRRS